MGIIIFQLIAATRIAHKITIWGEPWPPEECAANIQIGTVGEITDCEEANCGAF